MDREARVAKVSGPESLRYLVRRFPPVGSNDLLNWQALSDEYDAIWVTKSAVDTVMRSWECETVLVLDPDVITHVERLDPVVVKYDRVSRRTVHVPAIPPKEPPTWWEHVPAAAMLAIGTTLIWLVAF